MHYMTVLVIEYESTAYQQYKMAKKKLGVFFQFFAREATLSNIGRARCAAINSDFLKIIISKYINIYIYIKIIISKYINIYIYI